MRIRRWCASGDDGDSLVRIECLWVKVKVWLPVSAKKTYHVLYFWKAVGSRISSMTLMHHQHIITASSVPPFTPPSVTLLARGPNSSTCVLVVWQKTLGPDEFFLDSGIISIVSKWGSGKKHALPVRGSASIFAATASHRALCLP